MRTVADRLSREQTKVAFERRRADRKPFVRPVTLQIGRRGESQVKALSKDLSPLGMGILSDFDWEVGRIGIIVIHLPVGPPVRARSKVHWCEPFGQGWYLSGWHFLDEEP